jgi:predicted dithiol-disulfide oxidoreductase (DUF899 family)
MTAPTIALPASVSREQWLAARKELLLKEKEATRARDAAHAARRRLPMVRIEKDYVFEGPGGKKRLLDLFEGRRQLLVHHFMWFDEPDKFCPGCSLEADQNYNAPFLAELHKCDVTLAAVARAPLGRIEEEKAHKGWTFPFYSSAGTDFNYDFQATLDTSRDAIEYNYRDAKTAGDPLAAYDGDLPARSVFLRDGDSVFHAYSAYTRGLDQLATHYNYLDLTPYGRQEAWEDSPPGWPQRPIFT